MNILSIDTQKLRSLISLTEARDSLQAELQKVEEAITRVFSDEPAAPKKNLGGRPKGKGRKAGPKAAPKAAPQSEAKAAAKPVQSKAPKTPAASKPKRRKGGKRRGALKESIVAELQAAGAKGVSVKDLASKLGVKNQNVHVWFATTGKTVGTKKIAPGVYRLR